MRKISVILFIIVSLMLVMSQTFAATITPGTFQVEIAGMAVHNSDNGSWYMLSSMDQAGVDVSQSASAISGWFGTKKLIPGNYDQIVILIGQTTAKYSLVGNTSSTNVLSLADSTSFVTAVQPTGTIIPTVTGYEPGTSEPLLEYTQSITGTKLSTGITFNVTWDISQCLQNASNDGVTVSSVNAPVVSIAVTAQ